MWLMLTAAMSLSSLRRRMTTGKSSKQPSMTRKLISAPIPKPKAAARDSFSSVSEISSGCSTDGEPSSESSPEASPEIPPLPFEFSKPRDAPSPPPSPIPSEFSKPRNAPSPPPSPIPSRSDSPSIAVSSPVTEQPEVPTPTPKKKGFSYTGRKQAAHADKSSKTQKQSAQPHYQQSNHPPSWRKQYMDLVLPYNAIANMAPDDFDASSTAQAHHDAVVFIIGNSATSELEGLAVMRAYLDNIYNRLPPRLVVDAGYGS